MKQISSYVSGSTSKEELRDVEKHLLDCPFCTDAVEGLRQDSNLQMASSNVASLITDIRTRSKRYAGAQPYEFQPGVLLAVASVAILLGIVSFIFSGDFTNQSKPQLAELMSNGPRDSITIYYSLPITKDVSTDSENHTIISSTLHAVSSAVSFDETKIITDSITYIAEKDAETTVINLAEVLEEDFKVPVIYEAEGEVNDLEENRSVSKSESYSEKKEIRNKSVSDDNEEISIETLYLNEHYSEVIDLAKTLLRADDENYTAIFYMAGSTEKLKKNSDAQKWYMQLHNAKINAYSFRANVALARILVQEGKKNDAIEILNHSMTSDSLNKQSYQLLIDSISRLQERR